MADVTLAALLTAVERWQGRFRLSSAAHGEVQFDLEGVDVPAIRQSAHQHAEALREAAAGLDNPGCSLRTPLEAAADFLDGKAE